MRGVRRRSLRRVAAVVSVAGVSVWAPVLGGSAPAYAATVTAPKLQVRYRNPEPSARERAALRAAAQSPSATSIPLWNANIQDGTSNNTYATTFVGASPSQSNATTKVAVRVIPLVVQFSGGGTYDPTVATNCSTDVVTKKTMSSPIFKKHEYVVGGTDLGKGQYIDEFRRAEYWGATAPGSIAPKYHTKLQPKLVKKITVTVPAGDGVEVTIHDSCKLAEVDYFWLDNYLRTTIPTLAGVGVTPGTFPMFLVTNVVSYDNSGCCILGFHSAMLNSAFNNAVQTYGISDYDTTTGFPANAVADVSVLSHEVGEWLDDPLVSNGTDPWGHIGQVSGCQDNFEVGDPLSGTLLPVVMGKNTYHVQELAFFSWFYHFHPSGGVNGWYSFNGSFQSPALPCA